MRRILRGLGAVAVALAALPGCGASGDAEQTMGSSVAPQEAPPPPPPVDPAAGPPALLAGVGSSHVLLDGSGRVARVLPRSLDDAHPCPGGRVWVSASDYSGGLVVRTLEGRRVWRQRIPVRTSDAIACMDPAGRRVALVQQSEQSPPPGRSYWVQRLLIVSRGGVVNRPRHIGTTPLLERDRMYMTDERGMEIRAVPSGRTLRRIRGEVGIHDVFPSPDRRLAALTRLQGTTDVFLLADLRTGRARRIRIPRMRVVGWLAPDRLAVRADRRLIVLDPALREVARVEGFRPTNYVVAGSEVVALDGTTLISVRPGAGPPRTLGTVPAETTLVSPWPPAR